MPAMVEGTAVVATDSRDEHVAVVLGGCKRLLCLGRIVRCSCGCGRCGGRATTKDGCNE